MRILRVSSSSTAQDEVPEYHITPENWKEYRIRFEKLVLTALDSIKVPSDTFHLTAVMDVREAEKAGIFHRGYGQTYGGAKRGQPFLVNQFRIQLDCKDTTPARSFLLCVCGLPTLYNHYQEMVRSAENAIPSERNPVLASELAKLIHGQIVNGTTRMRGQCAEVLADYLLNHQKALANYERLGDFLKTFNPHG